MEAKRNLEELEYYGSIAQAAKPIRPYNVPLSPRVKKNHYYLEQDHDLRVNQAEMELERVRRLAYEEEMRSLRESEPPVVYVKPKPKPKPVQVDNRPIEMTIDVNVKDKGK